jgi:hypothetical protein
VLSLRRNPATRPVCTSSGLPTRRRATKTDTLLRLGQGVYAGSLDGGSSKRLTNADTAAVVAPSGFLLCLRQTTLFVQAFDFKRQELSGNPFPVAEQVAYDATLECPVIGAFFRESVWPVFGAPKVS